ncbi:Disease resistance protein [Actinidia chinensis var. chinensis]|uniref:Disease resistance protein n=1 Tax=Actinidia chinensis var. chinensis TaxID=1590841 RepID=A0A2R6R3B7_ACTCC|nr:Disease resistance protein [Actinidia chinensis var. chinensis]
MGTSPEYILEGLSDEDCHELLLKWAGCEKVGEQHVKLAEIASEIVKKCHGYPLAAKTLGSLLFMKTDENEWLYLKDRELWELAQNKRDILPVLKLSYDTLPADMKRCFLYCSLFPKCYEIEVDKLIQLWMAEGLIQSYINHELEYAGAGAGAGAEYVNHLCSINFLEKIRDQCGNLSNKCRMPEIIHDLAVFISEKEYKGIASYRSGIVIPEEVKHVSIHDSDCSREEVTKSLFMLMNLRSVLYFPSQGAGANEESFIERCISRFKYLRVLDLSDSCFQVLPRYVGNLKHLRFLDLSGNASMEKLPNTICKLYNLQTLRIWYCKKIRKLPQNLGNLISLKHLYLTTQQSCLPEKQIRRLTSLRTLGIEGCGNLTSLPEGIQLLTALTTVTIATCPKLTSLPSSMKNMANLRNLEISKCPNLNLSGWEHFKGLKRLH